MPIEDAPTIFYSSFFHRGYIGIQNILGDGKPQMLLFSMWGSDEAIPADGAYCVTQRENEGGHSCRLLGVGFWRPGGRYTLHVEFEGDGWTRGFIRGNDGLRADLGSIHVPGKTDLGSYVITFVEQWFVPCADDREARDVGMGSALFYPPLSEDTESPARTYGAHIWPRCPHGVFAPYDGGRYIETRGDSVFGPDDRERLDAMLVFRQV